jgi:hypothetical protein
MSDKNLISALPEGKYVYPVALPDNVLCVGVIKSNRKITYYNKNLDEDS